MTRVRHAALAFLIGALIGSPTAVSAFGDGTPDEMPPAEELPCDAAPLSGAAYGLCIAFCEANDCEIQPDKHACDVLRLNYMRMTGDEIFPCEDAGPDVQ